MDLDLDLVLVIRAGCCDRSAERSGWLAGCWAAALSGVGHSAGHIAAAASPMSLLLATAALTMSAAAQGGALPASSGEPLGALLGLALGLTAALGLTCCTPCASQLLCSCCFKASRRRSKPDNEAVPAEPQFSAAWLSAALRRGCPASADSGGPLAARVHRVASLQHGQLSVATDDGGEVINGGGLAGGRTMRVSKITYERVPGTEISGGEEPDELVDEGEVGAPASLGRCPGGRPGAAGAGAGPGSPLPTSMIAKWCSDVDVVGGSKDHPDSVFERVFIGWVLGLRHAMDQGMVREVNFYNNIAKGLVAATGLRLPVMYYTGVDGGADTGCCLYTWRRDSVRTQAI